MRWRDLPLNPTAKTLRWFGIFTMLVLGWFGFLQLWGNLLAGKILLSLAFVFGATGLVRPRWLRGAFITSVIATFPIGWLVSRVMLLVLFFAVFTPLGLLFRWFGRDALHLRLDPERDTYWCDKPPASSVRGYFRQS